ncbi:hypothetical protein PUN28_008192 [Cardiocondyla obscurior]|uniref:MADF domain-containing protein n=1 Tax=Cardiocondyla obscurior TaxID=286306 RepID=A0AAW2FYN9_9HYME
MSFQWNDTVLRKLIESVKCNTHLYNKNNKLFKDINAKSLTWESIKTSRKFKTLRDFFAKEHKRMKSSAGRSGDGKDDVDQSNSSWEFYYDLLFLVEHITKRK